MSLNRSKISARTGYYLTYEFRAGSMPPPAHYEYTIRFGPDAVGEIVYAPDYPSHNPPVWRETFVIPQAYWVQLCECVDQRVLSRTWPAAQRHAVGGSQEWLEIVIGKTRISVPAQLEERDERRIREVYERIRTLVPEALWKGLQARREAYEEEYLAKRQQG